MSDFSQSVACMSSLHSQSCSLLHPIIFTCHFDREFLTFCYNFIIWKTSFIYTPNTRTYLTPVTRSSWSYTLTSEKENETFYFIKYLEREMKQFILDTWFKTFSPPLLFTKLATILWYFCWFCRNRCHSFFTLSLISRDNSHC